MEALALAWPQITTLSLRSLSKRNLEPRLTLQSLAPLVQRCQRLETLRILLNSPIDNPHTVAMFLTRIFPKILELHNIDYIDMEDDEPEIHGYADWSEVDKLLKILVAVHAEER